MSGFDWPDNKCGDCKEDLSTCDCKGATSMDNDQYFEAPAGWRPGPGFPPGVFLAGGITNCPPWHKRARALLRATGVDMVILNPNRENFPIHDPNAGREQVWWEQDHLLLPETVTMMWYPESDPALTTQPIAMFELGQCLNPATIAAGRRFVVGADPGYPRAADVKLMMAYHQPDRPVYSTLEGLVAATAREVTAAASARLRAEDAAGEGHRG